MGYSCHLQWKEAVGLKPLIGRSDTLTNILSFCTVLSDIMNELVAFLEAGQVSGKLRNCITMKLTPT